MPILQYKQVSTCGPLVVLTDYHCARAVQDIVHEAIAFLWALVLYKPSLLRVINTCNMEAPTAKQPCATRDWPAILVCSPIWLGQTLTTLIGK